jgi:hypothetical protein
MVVNNILRQTSKLSPVKQFPTFRYQMVRKGVNIDFLQEQTKQTISLPAMVPVIIVIVIIFFSVMV